MKTKWPPHNMIVIDKASLELFSLSYVIYRESDVVQCVKHDLEIWEVAQLLGGN
jgi:hypothetical protein